MVTFVFNTMPPDFCRSVFRLFTVNSCIDACGNSFGPLTVLTLFTIATAREHRKILKLSTSQNEIRQARYRAHKSIMIMLSSMNILCVTYFFHGCFGLILDTASNRKKAFIFHVIHTTFVSLALDGSVMMSAMNFFIFVIFWKKFREELKKTICSIISVLCCCCK